MKLHFSACGNYLHIASVEAQIGQIGGTKRRVQQLPPQLRICILLSTYRLSVRKTTRSPPSLIHRVKAELGEFSKLNVPRLPFTLTWTAHELFVTQSTSELRVMRIALFRDTNSCMPMLPGHNIVVPKNRTFLPDTAAERDVHFVPSADGKSGCVLIGSKTRPRAHDKPPRRLRCSKDPLLRMAAEILDKVVPKKREILAPPIGCFLKEEDLGWVPRDEVRVTGREGVGKFDRRREKFDPVDDCEGESRVVSDGCSCRCLYDICSGALPSICLKTCTFPRLRGGEDEHLMTVQINMTSTVCGYNDAEIKSQSWRQ